LAVSSPSSKLSDWAFTEQENAIANSQGNQEEFSDAESDFS